MLISEAITYCEYMTGQVVASEQLVRWLSELDGRLAFEFYRTGEWAPYDPTDDTGAELLVPFPWDGMYVHHLAAKTYFSNGEYDRYENERVMSEQTLADFRSFMQRTQAALCGGGFPTDKTGGTYVTVIPEQASSLWFWIDAYSLAVKHGFSGTEAEWLEALKGKDGLDGQDGNDGAAAGFGTVTASVDNNVGTPSVTVTVSGPNTAKEFSFAFHNLKGADGNVGTITTSTPTTITGILKGNGSNVGAATAGTDYQAPLTAGTDYATPAMLPDAVTANPTLAGTESSLTGLQVGSTKYKVDAGASIRQGTVALSAAWSGSGPYTQSVTVTGATVTAHSRIDLQPTAAQLAALIADGVQALTVENDNGALTVYALGAAASAAMTIACTVTEVAA